MYITCSINVHVYITCALTFVLLVLLYSFCMFQIEFSPSTVDITTDMSTLIGQLVSCTSDFKRLSQILNKKSTKVNSQSACSTDHFVLLFSQYSMLLRMMRRSTR